MSNINDMQTKFSYSYTVYNANCLRRKSFTVSYIDWQPQNFPVK